jgi:7-cyano-7-deazaguanine synthase in queuosine biosynthesis
MFQTNRRKVAITISGGIDSTVLAYYLCENDGYVDFLSPTPYPPKYKTQIWLIQANIGEAANTKATAPLLDYHRDELTRIYGEKFEFCHTHIRVPIPSWSGNSLQQDGFVPDRHGDNPDQKTFTELGPKVFIDGRNAMLFTWLLSFCSKEEILTLITGHQYEIYEWDQLDTYRARTEDVGPAFVDRMNLLSEVGFRNRVRIAAPWLDMRLNKYQIVLLGRRLGIDLEGKTYSCYFHPPCGKCGNCIIRQKVLSVIAR